MTIKYMATHLLHKHLLRRQPPVGETRRKAPFLLRTVILKPEIYILYPDYHTLLSQPIFLATKLVVTAFAVAFSSGWLNRNARAGRVTWQHILCFCRLRRLGQPMNKTNKRQPTVGPQAYGFVGVVNTEDEDLGCDPAPRAYVRASGS
jgi:hypothetical protein